METFSVLLAICAGNSPVNNEFPAPRSVTQSFDVFFDLLLNKRLSKQSWGCWFESPSCPWWRHCNVHASNWTIGMSKMRKNAIFPCVNTAYKWVRYRNCYSSFGRYWYIYATHNYVLLSSYNFHIKCIECQLNQTCVNVNRWSSSR